MLPDHYVFLKELPKNANMKTDRAALKKYMKEE